MIQSLIFDMDGTLFQTDKILAISLEDAFNNLRTNQEWTGETPVEKYREIMGVPLPEVWKTLMPDHSNEIREQTNIYFQNRLVENIRKGKGALYPNVEKIFTYLKEIKCSIFIASNGQKDYLNEIVSYYKLNRWISETYSIEQIKTFNKTDLVQEIVEKYNIRHGAVVGDRLSDINAAKGNGLISIGCNFEFARDEELSKADLVINDLIELRSIVSDL